MSENKENNLKQEKQKRADLANEAQKAADQALAMIAEFNERNQVRAEDKKRSETKIRPVKIETPRLVAEDKTEEEVMPVIVSRNDNKHSRKKKPKVRQAKLHKSDRKSQLEDVAVYSKPSYPEREEYDEYYSEATFVEEAVAKKRNPVILSAILVLVLLCIGGVSVFALWNNTLGKLQANKDHLDDAKRLRERLPIQQLQHAIPYDKEITNILLLGIDSRDMTSLRSRSDSMMIMSINQKEKKVKLLSLQRDMLVYIPGKTAPDKLTHATAYGGPTLTMATIENILRIKIDNYVAINMRKMETLVNTVGGVELDVTAEILPYVNSIIERTNRVFSSTPAVAPISKPGKQVLNGRQAVSFARNRDTGRGDYDRMDRQQEVIMALFKKIKKADIATQLKLVSEVSGMIATDLTNNQILGLTQTVLPLLSEKMERMTIPIPGYHREYMGEMWVNLCDFNGMIPHVQKYLYNKTFPFDLVPQIPGAPNSEADIDDFSDKDEWVPNDQEIDEVINDSNYTYEPEEDYSYDNYYENSDSVNDGDNYSQPAESVAQTEPENESQPADTETHPEDNNHDHSDPVVEQPNGEE